MANQIEVHLSTGKVLTYDGQASDVGNAHRSANGLVQLKEWGGKQTFYLNPDFIVLVIDHGAAENAGTLTGRTVPRPAPAPAPTAAPTTANPPVASAPPAPATPPTPPTTPTT